MSVGQVYRLVLRAPDDNLCVHTISQSETLITSIERDGFWLLTEEGEYFISFEGYPDFMNATIAQIHNYRQSFDGFHWPDLDIDIELDALKHPARFPLKFTR